MENLGFSKMIKSRKIKYIIVFILTFLFSYIILTTALTNKKYDLKEGDIAKGNIRAPREFKDDSSTNARIQSELALIQPQFSKKMDVSYTALNNINTLFPKVLQIKDSSAEDKDKAAKLKNDSPIILSNDDLSSLVKLNKDELKDLQNFLVKIITDLYQNYNVVEDSQSTIDKTQVNLSKVKSDILDKINSSQLSSAAKDIAAHISSSQLKADTFYDKDKTEALKTETMKKVAPVIIKKDQIIVKDGEPVTKYQIEILNELGLLNKSAKFQWTVYIGLAILVLLIISIQWIYIYKYSFDIFDDVSKLILIGILNIMSIFLSRTISTVSPFLIPISFTPMLLTLLINEKLSVIISLINCVLIGIAVSFNTEFIMLAIISSILGSLTLNKLQQRNDIMHSSIYISIVNLVMTFIIGILVSNNFIELLKISVFSIAAGIVSGVLTIGFLPFFESSFDIVTTIKLLELSNPNNVLLKKLLLEAPGTYHHSVLVANLAEVAAEEVNANPVLARVAAYYHDIGKIKRPYFFKENQIGNDNPHNKITPNLSSLIIISHVKDGLELAEEYRIPQCIRDVIVEHHGTSLVKYFYITLKNSSEHPEDVNEEDFRYPGPIPASKESAIIMLADSVEAAVRSINNPEANNIEVMVNNIIKGRLDDGQLDNSCLTLNDLKKIKQAFYKVLMGIYHKRIEYPIDKWENKNDGR